MTNPLFKGLRARLKTSGVQAINCRCRVDAIHFQGNCRWPLIGIKVCACVTCENATFHNESEKGKSFLCNTSDHELAEPDHWVRITVFHTLELALYIYRGAGPLQ